jgi:uncharacterized RDD family membrane protein YckC
LAQKELVVTAGERLNDPFDPAATPEFFAGVTLKRVVAYLIDFAIIGILSLVALAAFWVLGVLSFGLLSPLFAVLLPFIPLAYHTAFIGGPESATPGMRLFGIEVHRIEGDRPGYLQAGLQTIVFYVSVGLTSWLVLLVALFNGRGRTFHDYLCGTVTIVAPKRVEVRAP